MYDNEFSSPFESTEDRDNKPQHLEQEHQRRLRATLSPRVPPSELGSNQLAVNGGPLRLLHVQLQD